FPARATLGRYLETRLAELRALGVLDISAIARTVDAIRPDPDGWQVKSGGDWHGPYCEVLLVLGQPDVTPDDQLADWQRHVRSGAGELMQAYPGSAVEQQAATWTGQTVAIRGLALSAFDVLRLLTTARGGRFEDGRYIPSGCEPARIVPFSLDGRPPSPKPATEAIDTRFEPTEAESAAFAAAIADAATTGPEAAQDLLTKALVPPVTRILRDTGGAADAVSDWLATEWTAPGTQESDAPIDALHAGIAMAEGTRPPSVGYTVGQVWRKWQDALRIGFNPARTPPDTAGALVGFDEGLKRYSYGPPVSSSQELAALIDAGIVDLNLATDPDIDLIATGWAMKTQAGTAEATVMIDGVMPSPDLGAIRAPLIAGLLSEGRLAPRADKLAANTAGDGTLIGGDGGLSDGLCLLGRLALGSVIAADSLHDCFGEASKRWACGVIERIG
ncbi:unnamed protein product, partial [Ectocarpus sp. 12 AP-2014]